MDILIENAKTQWLEKQAKLFNSGMCFVIKDYWLSYLFLSAREAQKRHLLYKKSPQYLQRQKMNKSVFRAGSMVTPVKDFTEIIRMYSEEYQHYNGEPVKCIHMHNSFAKYVSNVVKKFDSSGKY